MAESLGVSVYAIEFPLQDHVINPNRLDYYKILLRKCIGCDCVITGTPKWARKRWPASDTRWLDLLVHGAGVREVRGSKPEVATTLLLTLFRVRWAFLARG